MANFDTIFSSQEVKKSNHPTAKITWIHYTKLVDSSMQYCNETDKEEIIALAMTIKLAGKVLENLRVRKISADKYEILAGHKRRRAVMYLTEEEGEEGFEFLPCITSDSSDVHSEIEVIVSNQHHTKTDAEKLYEIERLTELIKNHPEEFPHLDTGRMVERLARQLNMSKTTAGEYVTISKNLGDKAREEFDKGKINKSAALELAALGIQEQEKLIDEGITSRKEIKAYKEEREPHHTKPKTTQNTKPDIHPEPAPEIHPVKKESDVLPGQYEVINTDMDIECEDAAERIQRVYDEVSEVLTPEELENLATPQEQCVLSFEKKGIKNPRIAKAYEMLESYRRWGLVERCDIMSRNYYQTTLSNGNKVIAEESMIERNKRITFTVLFYLIEPGTRYAQDGLMSEKEIAEAIAITL